MRSMQQWLDAYGESHQNPVNKTIHWICVPIIFLSIIGLMSAIPAAFLHAITPVYLHPYVHWGTVFIAIGLLFYLRLRFVMFMSILVWSIFCIWAVTMLALLPFPVWATSLVLFTAAWIGQFYGHKVEGAKPSFFEDLQFLLIGPAWLIAFILQKFKIKY